MVWGKGGLLNAFSGGSIPCLDFAGGTVVHISSGVSALVCALYLGKRKATASEPMKPHSLVLSVIGACLLWVGWFGFNAGSALAASALATSAFVATHFATAAAALGWMFVEWIHNGKPSVLGAISGAVAGLGGHHARLRIRQAVSRAADRLRRRRRLLLHGDHGEEQVRLRRYAGRVRRARRGRNAGRDSHRRFRHQGRQRRPEGQLRQVAPLGLVDGKPGQVLNQAIGVAISYGLAIVGTLVILKICDALIGVRVSPDQEMEGLDLSMHGEEGYNFEA